MSSFHQIGSILSIIGTSHMIKCLNGKCNQQIKISQTACIHPNIMRNGLSPVNGPKSTDCLDSKCKHQKKARNHLESLYRDEIPNFYSSSVLKGSRKKKKLFGYRLLSTISYGTIVIIGNLNLVC